MSRSICNRLDSINTESIVSVVKVKEGYKTNREVLEHICRTYGIGNYSSSSEGNKS